jgi:hypothetical protein
MATKLAPVGLDIDDRPREIPVPGCQPIIFRPKDFVNELSWVRFLIDEQLTENDFADVDQWKRYFYWTLGLLNGGVIIIGGPEGNGKSCWMYYTAYHMRDLFGKKCTFDVAPKNTFGAYSLLDEDTEFQDQLRAFGKLALMEKKVENGEATREDFDKELSKLELYNRVIGTDEAYEKLDKSHRTNYSKDIGKLVRKWRHYYNLFMFVSPDPRDIDRRMVYDRRSHEVRCWGEVMYEGVLTYEILWKRKGVKKVQHITPAKWSFLWETHNIIGQRVLSKPPKLTAEDKIANSKEAK